MTRICVAAVAAILFIGSGATTAHDGPDPVVEFKFRKTSVKEKQLVSRLGPNAYTRTRPEFSKGEYGEALALNGRGSDLRLGKNYAEARPFLPKESFTVSTWVAIEQPTEYGGILGVIQDNGNYEKGWVVGYDQNSKFYFGLSTKGADDGDGMMTYLTGKTKFELGKFYHLAAVYDGKKMELYINGNLDATSNDQKGEVLYPNEAEWVVGAYKDKNEYNPMKGMIRELAVYDLAAKQKWIKEEFGHAEKIARLPAYKIGSADEFIVKPYLQYGTQTSMTVAWRVPADSKSKLMWGEDIMCTNRVDVTVAENGFQHGVISELKRDTQYFYLVESELPDGKKITSDVSTFQTAPAQDTPFAFAVISDTQSNPKVNGAIAKLAWARRPSFLLHSGDLVDRGGKSDDWIDEFFASMHPLISRVPMFPVLGNHEDNAKNYFDYMVLPAPEYYYQFSYGNADFFMIDSNRKVDPDSEQYKWLDKALGESKATWKFVCHHHPPYSSDENDYGDLWKSNKSTRGDLRMRPLTRIYEKHKVDIVWNGHIHSYERTWPLREGKAVEKDGTIYMITGGGGGGLETPGPYRPYFQNNVQRGHHYVMVSMNGRTLEMRSFDLNDQLFDTLRIKK